MLLVISLLQFIMLQVTSSFDLIMLLVVLVMFCSEQMNRNIIEISHENNRQADSVVYLKQSTFVFINLLFIDKQTQETATAL